MSSAANVELVYDHVAMRWTNIAGAVTGGSERIGAGSLLRLENGATVTIAKGYGTTFGVNAGRLELTGGATYTASSEQNMSFIGGTQVLVDDSTFVGRTIIGMNTNAKSPTTWTFAGASPPSKLSQSPTP